MAENQAKRLDPNAAAHSLNSLVEAATRLKISRDTLLRLIKNGEIRVDRISRRVLIGEAELRRIVRCGCGSTTRKHMTKGEAVPLTAAAIGRLGGLRRAERLSKKQIRAIGKKGARVRGNKHRREK